MKKIILFTVSKEEAEDLFFKWLRSSYFLPDNFKPMITRSHSLFLPCYHTQATINIRYHGTYKKKVKVIEKDKEERFVYETGWMPASSVFTQVINHTLVDDAYDKTDPHLPPSFHSLYPSFFSYHVERDSIVDAKMEPPPPYDGENEADGVKARPSVQTSTIAVDNRLFNEYHQKKEQDTIKDKARAMLKKHLIELLGVSESSTAVGTAGNKNAVDAKQTIGDDGGVSLMIDDVSVLKSESFVCLVPVHLIMYRDSNSAESSEEYLCLVDGSNGSKISGRVCFFSPLLSFCLFIFHYIYF